MYKYLKNIKRVDSNCFNQSNLKFLAAFASFASSEPSASRSEGSRFGCEPKQRKLRSKKQTNQNLNTSFKKYSTFNSLKKNILVLKFYFLIKNKIKNKKFFILSFVFFENFYKKFKQDFIKDNKLIFSFEINDSISITLNFTLNFLFILLKNILFTFLQNSKAKFVCLKFRIYNSNKRFQNENKTIINDFGSSVIKDFKKIEKSNKRLSILKFLKRNSIKFIFINFFSIILNFKSSIPHFCFSAPYSSVSSAFHLDSFASHSSASFASFASAPPKQREPSTSRLRKKRLQEAKPTRLFCPRSNCITSAKEPKPLLRVRRMSSYCLCQSKSSRSKVIRRGCKEAEAFPKKPMQEAKGAKKNRNSNSIFFIKNVKNWKVNKNKKSYLKFFCLKKEFFYFMFFQHIYYYINLLFHFYYFSFKKIQYIILIKTFLIKHSSKKKVPLFHYAPPIFHMCNFASALDPSFSLLLARFHRTDAKASLKQKQRSEGAQQKNRDLATQKQLNTAPAYAPSCVKQKQCLRSLCAPSQPHSFTSHTKQRHLLLFHFFTFSASPTRLFRSLLRIHYFSKADEEKEAKEPKRKNRRTSANRSLCFFALAPSLAKLRSEKQKSERRLHQSALSLSKLRRRAKKRKHANPSERKQTAKFFNKISLNNNMFFLFNNKNFFNNMIFEIYNRVLFLNNYFSIFFNLKYKPFRMNNLIKSNTFKFLKLTQNIYNINLLLKFQKIFYIIEITYFLSKKNFYNKTKKFLFFKIQKLLWNCFILKKKSFLPLYSIIFLSQSEKKYSNFYYHINDNILEKESVLSIFIKKKLLFLHYTPFFCKKDKLRNNLRLGLHSFAYTTSLLHSHYFGEASFSSPSSATPSLLRIGYLRSRFFRFGEADAKEADAEGSLRLSSLRLGSAEAKEAKEAKRKKPLLMKQRLRQTDEVRKRSKREAKKKQKNRFKAMNIISNNVKKRNKKIEIILGPLRFGLSFELYCNIFSFYTFNSFIKQSIKTIKSNFLFYDCLNFYKKKFFNLNNYSCSSFVMLLKTTEIQDSYKTKKKQRKSETLHVAEKILVKKNQIYTLLSKKQNLVINNQNFFSVLKKLIEILKQIRPFKFILHLKKYIFFTKNLKSFTFFNIILKAFYPYYKTSNFVLNSSEIENNLKSKMFFLIKKFTKINMLLSLWHSLHFVNENKNSISFFSELKIQNNFLAILLYTWLLQYTNEHTKINSIISNYGRSKEVNQKILDSYNQKDTLQPILNSHASSFHFGDKLKKRNYMNKSEGVKQKKGREYNISSDQKKKNKKEKSEDIKLYNIGFYYGSFLLNFNINIFDIVEILYKNFYISFLKIQKTKLFKIRLIKSHIRMNKYSFKTYIINLFKYKFFKSVLKKLYYRCGSFASRSSASSAPFASAEPRRKKQRLRRSKKAFACEAETTLKHVKKKIKEKKYIKSIFSLHTKYKKSLKNKNLFLYDFKKFFFNYSFFTIYKNFQINKIQNKSKFFLIKKWDPLKSKYQKISNYIWKKNKISFFYEKNYLNIFNNSKFSNCLITDKNNIFVLNSKYTIIKKFTDASIAWNTKFNISHCSLSQKKIKENKENIFYLKKRKILSLEEINSLKLKKNGLNFKGFFLFLRYVSNKLFESKKEKFNTKESLIIDKKGCLIKKQIPILKHHKVQNFHQFFFYCMDFHFSSWESSNCQSKIYKPKTQQKTQYFNLKINIGLIPSKKNLKKHLNLLKNIILKKNSQAQKKLLYKLSYRIINWSYYYKIVTNSQLFYYCDKIIYKLLWKWACRNHPKKSKKWIQQKYFFSLKNKKWVFGILPKNFDSKSSRKDIYYLPFHNFLIKI
uniref:Group II intron maturase-specific domain-containing protein n=1 Tax=Pediastrum duplex TaxID=3105 RepID=A0A1W5RMM7_PEDDU|nr:hypothetical protein [Pediastrum duplex]AQU64399.1 hypothetical protein [Pediastrum duplex]